MKPRVLLPLLALGLLMFWMFGRDPGPAGHEPVPDAQSGSGDLSAKGADEASATDKPLAPIARRSLHSASQQPTKPENGLRVLVRWHDGTPAPNISLVLRRNDRGASRVPARELRSDAQGSALFTDLKPGKVSIRTERSKDWRSHKAEVKAAGISETTLTLEKGFDVAGRVVDERGEGVAGAEIWMSRRRRDWLGGLVVGQSGEQGEFRIRAVPMGVSFGALFAGRVPSALVDLDEADHKQDPLHIELQLGPIGGSLAGRVLDGDGEPIADAVLCLGKMPGRFPQRARMNAHKELWTPLVTRSGEDGSYRFAGVKPGQHPLAVRKPDLAISRTEVTIQAGAAATQDIVLTEGFAVEGIVFGEDGQPLTKARVRAFERPFAETYIQSGQYDYEDVFPYLLADTDAEGRYRIENLPPGERLVYAGAIGSHSPGSANPFAKTKLTGEDGEVLQWDARISAGRQIRGVALFRDGEPMSSHFVIANNTKTGKRHVGHTDRKGRFRFIQLDAAAYSVRVQMWNAPKGTPPLQKHAVMPDGGELRLIASYDSPKKHKPGTVKGRIEDVAQRVARPELLRAVLQSARSWRTDETVPKGVFEFKDLPPGRYKLLARSGEHIIYIGPWFELTSGQNIDLGTLQTVPGGSMRLEIRYPDDAPPPNIRGIWLRAPDSNQSQSITATPGKPLRIDNLTPGTHRLTIRGPNIMSARQEVEILPGGVADCRLDLRPAVLHMLNFKFASHPPIGHLAYKIQDANGKLIRESTLTHGSFLTSPSKLSVLLPLGRFHLQVSTKNGLKAKRDIHVDKLVQERQQLHLELK